MSSFSAPTNRPAAHPPTPMADAASITETIARSLGRPLAPVEQHAREPSSREHAEGKERGSARRTGSIYDSATATTFDVVVDQIPPALLVNLQRGFTEAEIETIFARSNQKLAPAQEQPQALWIFGPSAVGKSFMTGAKAANLFGVLQNAVVIDGTDVRETHSGYHAVALHGQQNGVLHADAWPIFKASALEGTDPAQPTLKRRLLEAAIAARQHIVYPDVCGNAKRLQALIRDVQDAGYRMHAVCLWAPLSTTRIRGEERSVREGKLWQPKDYEKSTRGTLAMAMRWLDGMRDSPSAFCSLELWDNTLFPAAEVGLEAFASLVMLSPEAADAHAHKLAEAAQRSHTLATAGNAKARETLAKNLGRRKSFAPLVSLDSWGADGVAEVDASGRPVDASSVRGGIGALAEDGSSRDVEAALSRSAPGTRPPPRSAAAEERLRRRHDWWRRGEGAVGGLLLGVGLGIASTWAQRCGC